MNRYTRSFMLHLPQVNAGLRTVCAALGAALFVTAVTPAPAADPWTGAIRCEIEVTAPGYSHQETQTWTLGHGAPMVQGAYEIQNATWSVSGQGWHDRTGQTARRAANWTASVPGLNSPIRAPVAFFRPGSGQLHVQLRHAQLVSSDGYRGTQQYIDIGGAARPETRLVQTLYEWTNWKIEADAADTQLTGTKTTEVTAGIAPLHPGDAQVMITLTWALGRGTAPAMPPATLPPPTPAPALGSSTPPANPPGATTPPPAGTPTNPGGTPGTPSQNPPGSTTPPTPPTARLVSLNPNSGGAGLGAAVQVVGENTHWVSGITTANFGPGITIDNVQVNNATSVSIGMRIDATAATSLRPVTLTTGAEVVTLPDAFTVTAAGSQPPPGGSPPAQPTITQVTPASAPPGARGLTVSITGSGTHFNNASWVEFGELVGATSFTVTSPTAATAVINIDPAAPPGPRTVSVITPVEGTASIPGETAGLSNGFTVGAPATSGRYRIAAVRAKIHREEFDNRSRAHGRNNELQFSAHTQVIDRRNGAKLLYGDGDGNGRRTVVHGDINNASVTQTSWDNSARIQAGSFASSGGIQTGDEISIWTTDGRPAAAVVTPSEYVPFVLWEGELRDGVDVVLIRPVVWLFTGEIGDGNQFSWPLSVRQAGEKTREFLSLPAISYALGRPEVFLASVPELVTTGQWLADQKRPFGLKVSGNQNGAPASWTDLVVVLTREKLEPWLTGVPQGRILEVRFVGSMSGPNAIPLGDCSLFLLVQRMPTAAPAGATEGELADAFGKAAEARKTLWDAILGIYR